MATRIEASRKIIGKYERNENSPSIEMALKMARAFGLRVDFLLGEGEFGACDRETVQRIQSIQKMDDSTRTIIFNEIDTHI